MSLPIPTETWNDVFLFLNHRLLKEKCQLVNHYFKEIAEHIIGNEEEAHQHEIERLDVRTEWHGWYGTLRRAAIFNHRDEELPIPEAEVTPNITGFGCIDVSMMDRQVLNFFRCIRPLLANGVRLSLEPPSSMDYAHLESPALRAIFGWMSFKSLTISGEFFDRFQASFPQVIANLPFLRIKNGISPKAIQKVAEWLDREQTDGEAVPVERKLEMSDKCFDGHQLNAALARQLLERFAFANAPSEPYCHSYFTYFPQPNFELTNNRTGEMLRQTAIAQIEDEDFYRMELKRFFPLAANGGEQNGQQLNANGPTSFQSVVLRIGAMGYFTQYDLREN